MQSNFKTGGSAAKKSIPKQGPLPGWHASRPLVLIQYKLPCSKQALRPTKKLRVVQALRIARMADRHCCTQGHLTTRKQLLELSIHDGSQIGLLSPELCL